MTHFQKSSHSAADTNVSVQSPIVFVGDLADIVDANGNITTIDANGNTQCIPVANATAINVTDINNVDLSNVHVEETNGGAVASTLNTVTPFSLGGSTSQMNLLSGITNVGAIGVDSGNLAVLGNQFVAALGGQQLQEQHAAIPDAGLQMPVLPSFGQAPMLNTANANSGFAKPMGTRAFGGVPNLLGGGQWNANAGAGAQQGGLSPKRSYAGAGNMEQAF